MGPTTSQAGLGQAQPGQGPGAQSALAGRPGKPAPKAGQTEDATMASQPEIAIAAVEPSRNGIVEPGGDEQLHTPRVTHGAGPHSSVTQNLEPLAPSRAIANRNPRVTADLEPALSIRQPWAWLILNGGKDIENRSWKTSFRGRFLIHASKGMTRLEYNKALSFVAMNAGIPLDFHEPAWNELDRGGIVGEAEIVDCVWKSTSPWFCGPYGFVIRNAKPLPFVPCKGALGFFKVP